MSETLPGYRPNVVVVGSGFGGFYTARRLCRSAVDVTVLSSTDGFLYAPLLPDVAVGTVDPRSAVVPLAGTLRGVRMVRGRATGIDLEASTVAYDDSEGKPTQLAYDRLVLAPGSVTRVSTSPAWSSTQSASRRCPRPCICAIICSLALSPRMCSPTPFGAAPR